MLQRLTSLLAKVPLPPIVPTQRAAWVIAAFSPLAVVIAALAPGLWVVAPVAAVALIALVLLAARRRFALGDSLAATLRRAIRKGSISMRIA